MCLQAPIVPVPVTREAEVEVLLELELEAAVSYDGNTEHSTPPLVIEPDPVSLPPKKKKKKEGIISVFSLVDHVGRSFLQKEY